MMIKNFLYGSATIFTCSILLTSTSIAQEVDMMDIYQHDRAKHQEHIEKRAQEYKDRWPEYVKERYTVDGVGVIDKEGVRAKYDEQNAPTDLTEADEEASETSTE